MGVVNNDLCLIIQERLFDHIGQQSNPFTAIQRTKKGFLDALESDANTVNRPTITEASFSEDSKNVSLRMRYWQGLARDSATGVVTDPCVAAAQCTPKSEDYTISGYAESAKSYSFNAYRDYCESKSNQMSLYLLQQMIAVEKKMNADLGAELFAAGVLPYAEDLMATPPAVVDSNAAPKTLKFFEDFATRQISPVGEDEFMNEFELADFDGTPIVVGRGKLRNYAIASEIACCNDAGQDLSGLGDGAFLYFEDRDLGVTLGNADAFYAWQPGSVQLLQQNKFLNDFAYRKTEFEFNDTMINPLSGIRHDITTRVEDCGVGRDVLITVKVSNNYGLFVLPTDVYDPSDKLSGYRQAVQFIAS